MAGSPVVGILALQGDFDKHRECLEWLGAKTALVKRPSELSSIDALVLPGGESTTLLKLADEQFRIALQTAIRNGLPTLATCAGLILLANEVRDPAQPSLQVLDVAVSRNAYGRQIDSFVDNNMQWTASGREVLKSAGIPENGPAEGVFIRAPKIVAVGPKAEVLIQRRTISESEAVLVAQGNILGATFHPELCDTPSTIHRLLLHRASNPA